MSAIERLTAADVAEEEAPVSERAQKRRHWPKGERISETPHSNHLVSRAYEHVMILEAMPSRYRGLLSVFGAMLLVAALFLGLVALPRSLGDTPETMMKIFSGELSGWLVPLVIVTDVLGVSLFLISFIAAVRFFRIDLLAPKQIPLVFNRKTRKVHRFIQDVPSVEELLDANGRLTVKSVLGFIANTFRPWPNMLLIEYDWDCLEAEYYETTRFTGQVIHTDSHLELFVRESPGSDKVIGSFALIPSILVGEGTARDLWEHVRRFMEEDGPVLSPGDRPAPPAPRGFWQAVNAPFNGPGWLVVLAGIVWTAEDIYWSALVLMRGLIPQALWEQALHYHIGDSAFSSVIKGVTIFVCLPLMGWIVFAVVASYLSPEAELPEDAMREAGEPIDLDRLAKAQAVVGA